MNYYIKNRNVYEHTVLSNIDSLTEEVAQEIQNTFDAKLSLLRKEAEKNVWILNNQTDINAIYASEDDNTVNSKAVEYYIPNYTYIRDAIYPKNENETCGYTAACILLNYWHKKKGNVIASTFLDAKGNLKTSGYTLQDQLLSYGKTTSTDGEKISNVINKYCEEYGVNATARYYWLNWDAFAEVNSGRPVIVFGLFPLEPEPASLGNTKHAVTAYGTRRSGSGGYLIVHYGWSGYEHVLLDPTLMGSSTQFVLN